MNESLQPLPLGSPRFSDLRKAGNVYADKTDGIGRLAEPRGKYLFLRPPRFGKSLLISTFASLFRDGLRDFRGLAVESFWRDATYPVLHLDFSLVRDFRDMETFRTRFDRMLDAAATSEGFDMPRTPYGPVARLRSFISRCADNSLVVLIDEFDAPLAEHSDEVTLFEDVAEELVRLYTALRGYEGILRFLFITGVGRVSEADLLSGLDNLKDLTHLRAGANLAGFTEEEIRTHFAPHLRRAAECLRRSEEELLDELERKGGGFRFDELGETRVFCPGTVLNFLSEPERGFECLRKEAEESAATIKTRLGRLKGSPFEGPVGCAGSLCVGAAELRAPFHYGAMTPEVLMLRTGCLTIRRAFDDGTVELGYPNEEVRESMSRIPQLRTNGS